MHNYGWEQRWDEWIFINPGQTMCDCHGPCITDKTKHRIATFQTQSKY